MKWDKDEYRELKWKIFDLLKNESYSYDCQKLTIKKMADQIDIFIFNLLENKHEMD